MNPNPELPKSTPNAKGVKGLARMFGPPLLLLLALVVAGRYAGRYWPDLESAVTQMGFSGYFLFFAAWVFLSMTCFPVSVLGVSAGALFGPWVGAGLVFPAGLVSGSLMFLLGRGLLYDRIRRMIAGRPKLMAVDRMAGDQALKLNLLTRLSPLNFGLASYTLASGPTSFRAYFGGLLAIVPSLIAQVWFGSIAREAGRATQQGGFSVARMVIMVSGLVFFGLLTWLVGRMVKKAWDEAPGQAPNQDDN